MTKRYMIATTATHQLGDLSRELCSSDNLTENLCSISDEDETNYIGMWVLGLGFFGVKFPKETTRELTPEEVAILNTKYVQLSDLPPQRLQVD